MDFKQSTCRLELVIKDKGKIVKKSPKKNALIFNQVNT